MKKKIVLLFLYSTLLVSCNKVGSSKIKNIVDLTDKLQIEENQKISFTSQDSYQDLVDNKHINSFKLTNNALIAKPAVAKNIIYSIDSKGFVSAYSMKENKVLWKTNIASESKNNHFTNGYILYSENKLYITNGSRYLIVLSIESGDELIRKEYPDIINSKPVITNDRILLIQTVSNQLVAYDLKSSKFLWMNEGGAEILSAKLHMLPVVNSDYVMVGYSSGELVYLNISSGTVKWIYNFSTINDSIISNLDPLVVVTTPIISGEYAYFATSNGSVIKMDLDNGAPAWIKKAEDIQSLSLIEDYLLVTNNARQVAILANHNGKTLWVGDLISTKERSQKRIKPISFQPPFLSKDKGSFTINILASNGELYQFIQNPSGDFPIAPNIKKITNKINYYWISCCTGLIYVVTDNSIVY